MNDHTSAVPGAPTDLALGTKDGRPWAVDGRETARLPGDGVP